MCNLGIHASAMHLCFRICKNQVSHDMSHLSVTLTSSNLYLYVQQGQVNKSTMHVSTSMQFKSSMLNVNKVSFLKSLNHRMAIL